MAKIIFVSGACGCGKTTFTNVYAKYLVQQNHKTIYVIHGDFAGSLRFLGLSGVLWEDILKFNWDCIIATAQRALQNDLNVLI